MPSLSRINDTNQAGGRILRGSSTVYAENRQVGLHPSSISTHGNRKRPHRGTVTTQGSPTVFADNAPVLRVTSGNSCGHSIVTGCSTVFVE